MFLTCLVSAMTLASGLLLVISPARVTPPAAAVNDAGDQNDWSAKLFDTDPAPDPDRYLAIVIRQSNSPSGSAQSLDKQQDQTAGLEGGGFHFVVNNGRGGPDGQIQRCFRWKKQLVGSHSTGRYAQWLNNHAIGICLIGDFDQQRPTPEQMAKLVWLVHKLQARFDIPKANVYHETLGPLFPYAQFREQLLTRHGR